MKDFDIYGLKICEFQARVFEKSLNAEYSSPIFIRRFMYSEVGQRIDLNAFLFEASPEDSVLEEINEEFGQSSYGKIKYSANEIYWIGYLYRYWSYTHEVSSKSVYKIVKPQELKKLYFAYHSLDPSQVIIRIKEAKGIEEEDLITKGVRIMRKIRAQMNNKTKLKTYCNPLNIEYAFQNFSDKTTMHREAADPSVVVFKDRYFLFASMSKGFWVSDNLAEWEFFTDNFLPATDYAPDVRVIGEYLYFSASKSDQDCSFYRTKNPLSHEWESIATLFPFWDPNLFEDTDGKIYFYWGCSNENPIYGVELDKKSFMPLGEKKALVFGDEENHGWERNGENNQQPEIKPFIEGAWMTKHNNTYYLQYAAPGTEYNIYADGVYVSKNPLGPFTYQKHNPISVKPGGFIRGAGHGSTFQDKYDNWWHISTMGICKNHIFERRIGLFPAGFTNDGTMFCNMNYSDFPTYIPTKKWNPLKDSFTNWKILSYNKKVITSSTEEGFSTSAIVDENIQTVWTAKSSDKQKWVQLDLGNIFTVNAIQINFAEVNCVAPSRNNLQIKNNSTDREILRDKEYFNYAIEISKDAINWDKLVTVQKSEKSHNYLEIANLEFRFIKLICKTMPYNGNFALSGFRIFGKSNTEKLNNADIKEIIKISNFETKITWTPTKNATGYLVKWGISKNNLSLSYMVYNSNSVIITSLDKDKSYFFEVEAF